MSTMPPASPSPEPTDAWLDDLLRPSGSAIPSLPPADHAQFTARVLTSLPPPETKEVCSLRLRRGLLLSAATVVGGGIAWLGGGATMKDSLLEVLHLLQQVTPLIDFSAESACYVVVGVSALLMLSLGFRLDQRNQF